MRTTFDTVGDPKQTFSGLDVEGIAAYGVKTMSEHSNHIHVEYWRGAGFHRVRMARERC